MPIAAPRIFSVAEIYAADKATIAAGTSGAVLMENAGAAVADIMRAHYAPCPVLVLCGPGNNGGDGFVIARLLHEAGWPVRVAALLEKSAYQGDAKIMAEHCPVSLETAADIDLQNTALAVDALFGVGLSKPLSGTAALWLEKISAAGLPVVAVDIPSGVGGDSGTADPLTPQAEHTVTFHAKKPGHVLLPGRDYCGTVHVADIGLALSDTGTPPLWENTPQIWRQAFPATKAGDHKYTRGHAVIFGGAKMTGAAKLAAHAAMRAGAGLATILCPTESFGTYTGYKAHLLVEPAATQKERAAFLSDPRKNTCLAGPGLGLTKDTREIVLSILKNKDKTACLDADALSVFEKDPETLFAALHENCVITPHEGEFLRLFGKLSGDKITRARKAAATCGATVLLKGGDTVIAAPDGRCVVNTNAPPFLATAGSGDVLAGILTGLLAQHMPVFEAAAAAAWLHGAAAARFGSGLVAEDIAESLPPVLQEITKP
ncbi:MAG: NAD(P)H-hydrate dehydratase [Micavibrio sp.]|nr:MAG: NAD(P)H-hydrate dehydratase [Micavibrio sp.]